MQGKKTPEDEEEDEEEDEDVTRTNNDGLNSASYGS
jgi:hypothetical protein